MKAQLLSKTSPDGMAEEGILPQAFGGLLDLFSTLSWQVLRRLVDSRRQVKTAMKAAGALPSQVHFAVLCEEKSSKVLQVLEIRQKATKVKLLFISVRP